MRFGEWSKRTEDLKSWYDWLFGVGNGLFIAHMAMLAFLPSDMWQRMVPLGLMLVSFGIWRLVARAWKRSYRADMASWGVE